MLFNIAFNCTDSFYMLVTNGIAIIFSIQTILNIGGVIKFIPSTGVTLPFVSYGGSSLVSGFIELGLLLSLSLRRQEHG
jgi:cell division protein FtsW (lipid II flippase)